MKGLISGCILLLLPTLISAQSKSKFEGIGLRWGMSKKQVIALMKLPITKNAGDIVLGENKGGMVYYKYQDGDTTKHWTFRFAAFKDSLNEYHYESEYNISIAIKIPEKVHVKRYNDLENYYVVKYGMPDYSSGYVPSRYWGKCWWMAKNTRLTIQNWEDAGIIKLRLHYSSRK